MTAHEDQIFISGPLIQEGRLVREGMTIPQTDSDVKAAEFTRNEPFVKLGLRGFELDRGSCAQAP
jgi:hypothetical protein